MAILEKEMATHSSMLAWEISWTEESGRATVHGVVRVGHNWVIKPLPPCMAESLFELSVSTSSVCLNVFKIGRWERASCALYPQGGLYKSLSSLRGVRGAAPRALSTGHSANPLPGQILWGLKYGNLVVVYVIQFETASNTRVPPDYKLLKSILCVFTTFSRIKCWARSIFLRNFMPISDDFSHSFFLVFLCSGRVLYDKCAIFY